MVFITTHGINLDLLCNESHMYAEWLSLTRMQADECDETNDCKSVHSGPLAAEPWLPAPCHRGGRPHHDQ